MWVLKTEGKKAGVPVGKERRGEGEFASPYPPQRWVETEETGECLQYSRLAGPVGAEQKAHGYQIDNGWCRAEGLEIADP